MTENNLEKQCQSDAMLSQLQVLKTSGSSTDYDSEDEVMFQECEPSILQATDIIFNEHSLYKCETNYIHLECLALI